MRPLRLRSLRLVAVAAGLGLLLPLVPVPAVEFSVAAAATVEPPTTVEPAGPDDLAAVAEVADEPLDGERVVAAAADVDRFTAIGLTFDGVPDGPVLVRVTDPRGRPGEWRELEVDVDTGPDGSGDAGTEALWVGEGSGYELNLGTADAGEATVHLVREELQRSVVDATPLADAATPPFGIGSRASWGARATGPASYGSTVRLAVVHHSASSNSYGAADVPAVLRSIQAFHMDGRGWSDIAYNFVVDKFGGIWEGRGGGIDRPVIGAHAMGFNTNTVGVMVIGDYTEVSASAASVESVSKVVGWKLALHGANPTGRVQFTSGGSSSIPAGTTVDLPVVVGHRDVGATGCPGTIQSQLGTIRQRSQEWTNWVRATSAPVGSIDRVVPGPGGLTAIGWALDLDASAAIDVTISVDGVGRSVRADQPRPDVAARFGTGRVDHGFWVDVGGLSPGWHDVCVTAWNTGFGENASLGCSGAAVPDPTGQSPVGAVDSLGVLAGGIDVSGWATDAGAAAVPVQLLVDGAWRRTVTTAGNRFSARLLGIPAGPRRVCAVGENTGPGATLRLDCRTVDVPGSNPIGVVDGITAGRGVVSTSGWALDPEQLGPIEVSLVVGGRWYSAWADRRRPEWLSRYPGYGDQHGFALGVPVAPGTHRVCVVAANVGGGVANTLACDDVVVK